MNRLKIFEYPEYCEIKDYIQGISIADYSKGWVYILEFGDFVKIGSTQQPDERFRTLKGQAAYYDNCKIGKMALSPLCLNFKEVERSIHKHLSARRKSKTELFNVTFDDAIKHLASIAFKQQRSISPRLSVNRIVSFHDFCEYCAKDGIIAQTSFYLLCKMDVHRTYHEGIRKIGRDIGVSCQTIRTVIGRMIKLGLIEVCDVCGNKNIIHINIPVEVYGD